MNEPIWIDAADIYAFHLEILSMFGGLDGMRDEGLLHSALSRPQHSFTYESPSIFKLAADYAIGIIKNHPFFDGNKRAGFMAAALFIEANGFRFEAPEEEVVINTLALATGTIDRNQYAEWLETSSTHT